VQLAGGDVEVTSRSIQNSVVAGYDEKKTFAFASCALIFLSIIVSS
jgi:hypothetical protein